jgi:amino acid transporter
MFSSYAGTLVGMFAVSRIIAAVARQNLLPPFLAKVHKHTFGVQLSDVASIHFL